MKLFYVSKKALYNIIYCCTIVCGVCYWGGEILWENSINCRKFNVKLLRCKTKWCGLENSRDKLTTTNAYFMRSSSFLNDLDILEVSRRKRNLSCFHMWSINVVLIMPCKISFVLRQHKLHTYTHNLQEWEGTYFHYTLNKLNDLIYCCTTDLRKATKLVFPLISVCDKISGYRFLFKIILFVLKYKPYLTIIISSRNLVLPIS